MARPVNTVGRIVALAGAALLVSGCTSIPGFKGYLVDEALLQSVQPGIDNRESVQRTLGQPSFISNYGEPVWYYVSSTTRQKPFTTPRTAFSRSLLMVAALGPCRIRWRDASGKDPGPRPGRTRGRGL